MQCSVLLNGSKLSIAQHWLFSANGIWFNTQTSLLTIHPEAENRDRQHRTCQDAGKTVSSESQTTISNKTHGDPDADRFYKHFLRHVGALPGQLVIQFLSYICSELNPIEQGVIVRKP